MGRPRKHPPPTPTVDPKTLLNQQVEFRTHKIAGAGIAREIVETHNGQYVVVHVIQDDKTIRTVRVRPSQCKAIPRDE